MPASFSPAYKLDAVRRVQARLDAGSSLKAACLKEQVPHTSFSRWKLKLEEGGEQALTPDYSACGRPRKHAKPL